jgi:hypothetical protein
MSQEALRPTEVCSIPRNWSNLGNSLTKVVHSYEGGAGDLTFLGLVREDNAL